MAGCDISHYQQITDYAALAAAAEFVILKATEGTSYVDPTFVRGAELRRRGVRVGAYHFARGAGPAAAEADYFVTHAAPRPGDILALDVEAGILTALPGQQLVAWCKAWLDRVKARTGTAPHIYMSLDVVAGRDWTGVAGAGYPLWLAAYRDTLPAVKWWPRPALWQHTSTGRIPGITGAVDLDIAVPAPKPAPPAATPPADTKDNDMPLTDADIDKVAAATVAKLLGTSIATVDAAQSTPANPTGTWTYTVRELWARLIRLTGLTQDDIRQKNAAAAAAAQQ